MKRTWEAMCNRQAVHRGVGAALQQIFDEDQTADAAMQRMIAKLDELETKKRGDAA